MNPENITGKKEPIAFRVDSGIKQHLEMWCEIKQVTLSSLFEVIATQFAANNPIPKDLIKQYEEYKKFMAKAAKELDKNEAKDMLVFPGEFVAVQTDIQKGRSSRKGAKPKQAKNN